MHMLRKKIKKPIIFLPVEVTVRELDYKLNIARLFSQQGFDAIVGNPSFIRDELKYKNYQGIFLEKGMGHFYSIPEYYQGLKDKGVLIYCLTDEGAEGYMDFCVHHQASVEALKSAERIFLWGKVQKERLIRETKDSELAKKYMITGYPGFDFNTRKYKDYHRYFCPIAKKNYILVNMNFGMFNGYPLEDVLEVFNVKIPKIEKSLEGVYNKEAKSFKFFSLWLKEIIRSYPKETFLIRPHPGERSSQLYLDLFGEFKNVYVSRQGNANQVIFGAKLLIHHDCTTALQGYLCGIPVISFSDPQIKSMNAEWSLAFGAQPKTVEEAKNLIDQILKDGKFHTEIMQSVQESAKHVLSSRFANAGNSTQPVVDVILSDTKCSFKNLSYKLHNSRSVLQEVKAFVRYFLPVGYKVPLASRNIVQSFTKKDLLLRLAYLDSIDGIRVNYEIKKMFHNTYFISVKS
jgi:surface carbohydrate biosynthesis protein